ncbi:hypothetical protein GGR42_002037 [Saonia flava]|uniref:Collagen-like protein n=1 Tax=Saonia flava TaxID=523696 RepID=A0A846R0W6_9FLAO|nr:collagen-like protein [Saonia flava]NJB71575.1 hypothetical protein [Saonia flava]
MKTNMKFKTCLLGVIFISTFFVSCSKDGEDGAIGPQGPQGEQGIAGPTGSDGEQGEPGTANVIYSDWIQSNFLNPNASTQNVMGLGTFSLEEYDITADVILVYGGNNINSGSFEVFQLPYTRINENEFFGFGLFGDGDGDTSLQVRVNTLDGSTSLFSYIDYYRYIIIPGEVVSTTVKSTLDYAKMSYKEICTHFNIPE